jgi:hypothetical protein
MVVELRSQPLGNGETMRYIESANDRAEIDQIWRLSIEVIFITSVEESLFQYL